MPGPRPSDQSRVRTAALYTGLVLVVTAAGLLVGTATHRVWWQALAQAAPALLALVFVGLLSWRRVAWAALGLHPRGRWTLWVAAPCIPAGIIVLAHLTGLWLGVLQLHSAYTPVAITLRMFLVPLFPAVLLPVALWALGEELGWRGFLAGVLNPVLGPRRATLLTAGVWVLFHLPFIVWGGYFEAGAFWPRLALFAATVVPMGVFAGWLRYRSGSVWPAVVFHTSSNVAWQIWSANTQAASPLAPYLTGEAGLVNALLWVGVAAWCWRQLPARREPRPEPSVQAV